MEPIEIFEVDAKGARQPAASVPDWDTAIGLMIGRRIPGLNAHGQMTGAILERVSRLEQLTHLDLSGCPVTDAGTAHPRNCEHLERVDLFRTPTGDGAIQALAGKPHLRHFKSGNRVTDAGLALLHQFPVFKTWQPDREPSMGLLHFDAEPNYLLLRGPFTDRGLATLAGLDGLFALQAAGRSASSWLAGIRCHRRSNALSRRHAAPALSDVPGYRGR